jgi:hypothetical protein
VNVPTFRNTSRALLLTGAALLATVHGAGAQTGITVYHDGRVLVRRTLPTAVPKGTSTQRVELGPIDPSSLVSLDPGVVINRALFDAAEDENAVLRRLVGRKLTVERGKQGGGTETFQVTLLGVDPARFLMPDGTVAFGNPGGALRYPADAVSTAQAATLTLTSASGRKDLPLGWFTDGAQWNASYSVLLGAKEARVTGDAVIASQSFGATDAEVQLLAGSVSRAAPAPAAYERADRVMMKNMAAASPPMPSEEGAGEFHLYTLPGKSTIQPGSTTTIALFDPASTAYEKRLVVRGRLPWYGFVPQQQDEQTVPVEVSYVLKRPLKTPFGDKPLPGGTARIYDPDRDGRLQLVGEASFGHSAPGEDVSLYAGNAFDLTAKRIQTEYTTVPEKRGNVTRTIATLGFKVTIRNGSDSAQSVDVREERGGEWSVTTSSVPAEKVSSSVTRFRVTVPARGDVVLTYTIRTVW